MKHFKILAGVNISLYFLAALLALAGIADACADEAQSIQQKYQTQADAAVDRALELLVERQLTRDEATALGKPELAGSFEDSFVPGNTGITALSVMAFLARGHVPDTEPYGDVINLGVDYLLSQQLPNGLIVSRHPEGRRAEMMYSHSIATLLLCEVSGMVSPERQEQLDLVLPKALLVLLQAQKVPKQATHAGGWRYSPGATDSDLSLTGWSIMALRAARLNGAAIPDDQIAEAIEYILNCRQDDGSFSYMPSQPHGTPSMTGLAVLCLELCGEHGHEAIAPAGDYLLARPPEMTLGGQTPRFRYYAFYYCSQAMFQLGGKYWDEFAPYMYESLLEHQRPDGSWGNPGEDGSFGNTYTTALAVLTLTVSARQLPIYQREE